jgi:HK97 family phage portal protein
VLFRKREQAEDRMLTRESLPPTMLPSADVGEGVSTTGAMRIAGVFACVRAIVDASILTPFVVYRKLADGSRQRVPGGKLVDLLTKPSPTLTAPALVAQLVQHLVTHGECFIGKVRPGGPIEALVPLAPDRMQVEVKRGVPVYTYYSPDPSKPVVDNLGPADVLHVFGLSLDGIRGASPISLCRNTFGLAETLGKSAAELYENGTVPSGIVKVPSGPGAQDQADALVKAWERRHSKRGRIAVVSGDVSFEGVSMTLADSEFIRTCDMSLQDIARIFGVPPSRINAVSSDSLTYSTVESEATAFATHALSPRLKLLEAAISADADLCSMPQYVEADLDALLRGDSAGRAAFYTQALNPATGWMDRNEVRERESLPPKETPAPTLPVQPPPPQEAATNGVGRIS